MGWGLGWVPRLFCSLGVFEILFASVLPNSVALARNLCSELNQKIDPPAVAAAFARAERLEKGGKLDEAKLARLDLAKRMAEKHGVPWPKELTDEKAADLIWAAHRLPLVKRHGGFQGAREYFARYLDSELPELEGFKAAFGPRLAKLLIRKGVAGEEMSFLQAAAVDSRSYIPRLALADWLDEHSRHASAELLRLNAELETLPVGPATVARRQVIQARKKEIEVAALLEWQESETASLLSTIGTFTSLSAEGLPVLGPITVKQLLAATPDQQRAILGLDLSFLTLTSADMAKLAKMDLNHTIYLKLNHTGLDDAGAIWISQKDSPFRNVTTLQISNTAYLSTTGIRALAGPDSPFSKVARLEISHLVEMDAEAVKALAAPKSPFRNVTHLNLEKAELEGGSMAHLAAKTSVFTNVQSLNLSENLLGAEGVRHLAGKDSPFKTVGALHLGSNGIGIEGARYLAASDSSFGNLSHLWLESNHLTSEGARYLAARDSVLKNVSVLYLANNQLGDVGVKHLSAVDSPFATVTSLYLASNRISSQGISHLAAPTSAFKQLQVLSLVDNPLGESGAAAFVVSGSPLHTVTSLDLSLCAINAVGAGSLASPLSPFGKVQNLDLGFNPIGDTGVQHLAAPTSVFKNIEVLNLASARLSGTAIPYLTDAKSPLKGLKKLTLTGNTLDKNDIEQIERELLQRP